jgi:peroxidase
VPVEQLGIDPLLKYLASDNAQEVDTQVVDAIRNMLFGPPGSGGQDLLALDIQRGRDHGLADYNTARQAYGLPAVTSFGQISSDPNVQAQLQALYGSVDNIDLLVGALAEDHMPGSAVGPTFQAILVDQFERTRAGDRLWFENTFSGPELDALERVTLADVIRWNTGLTNLQDNVFYFQAGTIAGHAFADLNQDGLREAGEPGLAGITVELRDAAGMLLATTVTAADGSYSFVGQNAGTSYQVDVQWPAELQPTSPTTLTVQLAESVGAGEFNTDFGAVSAPRPAPGSASDPLSVDFVAMLAAGSTPWAQARHARW